MDPVELAVNYFLYGLGVFIAVALMAIFFPHWFGIGRRLTYYDWNNRWLMLCCFFGRHRWVYDYNEKVRTCKHNWCAAREEYKGKDY